MKKSLCYTSLIAGTAIFLFSCQKVDAVRDPELMDKSKRNKQTNLCLINSLRYSNPKVPNQTIFNTNYDVSSRAAEVEAGLYSGGSILSTLALRVSYSSSGLAFIKADNSADTVLIASVDNKGKVTKVLSGNKPDAQYPATSFEYTNDRVAVININVAGKTETSYFEYDKKGNIVNITDAPMAGVAVPGKITYQYATNEKASQQFYLDEPRKFSWNTFSLLQYIGLFPELQPVNLRTATTVVWGNNYVAYDIKIGNQQLDAQGKLIGYDVINPKSGTTINHYSVGWNCLARNKKQNQEDGEEHDND